MPTIHKIKPVGKITQVAVWSRQEMHMRAPNPAHLSLRSDYDQSHKLGLTHHWTGEGGTLYKPNPVQRWLGIQAFHMDSRGMGDIAYENGYDADANIFAGRDARFVGAHALSPHDNQANRLTEGCCFLEDKRGWTDGAMAAFIFLHDIYALFNHHTPGLFAHRWWDQTLGKTICPGGQADQVVRFCGGHY